MVFNHRSIIVNCSSIQSAILYNHPIHQTQPKGLAIHSWHLHNRSSACFLCCLQFSYFIFTMGECISKNNLTKQTAIKPAPLQRQQAYGLQIIQGGQNSVRFHHAPLPACEFLSRKFSANSAAPEQVNLSFMVHNVLIDPTENLVTFTVINQNELNIYLILGGTELVNNTGLTVEINKIKYIEKVTRTEPSNGKGEELTVVPAKMSGEPIYLVTEPVLKNGQTMFIIQRHVFSQGSYRLKSMNLQWCSLTFGLQDIYGADNLFRCDNGQQCSVCLSSPANVILTPCRHMCLCSECSKSYEKTSRKCPICRAEYRATIGYK